MFFKAKEMLKKARQTKHGGHPTILARWYADKRYRRSLAEHNIGEKEVMLYDRIALERHDYPATRAERIQNAKHWVFRLNGNGNGFSRRSQGYDQADWVKKKLPNNFVTQTSECSQWATIAPAGWTSSGLRAPHQADGPRARWHLLRPLMQLLLTSAAPSSIETSSTATRFCRCIKTTPENARCSHGGDRTNSDTDTSTTSTASTTKSASRRRRKIQLLCRSQDWMAVLQRVTVTPAGNDTGTRTTIWTTRSTPRTHSTSLSTSPSSPSLKATLSRTTLA